MIFDDETFPAADRRPVGNAECAATSHCTEVMPVDRLKAGRSIIIVDQVPRLPWTELRAVGIDGTTSTALRREQTLPGEKRNLIAVAEMSQHEQLPRTDLPPVRLYMSVIVRFNRRMEKF